MAGNTKISAATPTNPVQPTDLIPIARPGDATARSVAVSVLGALLLGTFNLTITATGSTAADAFQIIAGITTNVCTTVAAGTGVAMPALTAPALYKVINQGANPLQLYANTAGTGTMLGLASVTIMPGVPILLLWTAANTWIEA